MKTRALRMRGRVAVLKRLFVSPRYVIVAALAAAAYYFLFFYVVSYGMGIAFVTSPVYLVYALIASSAVLAALGAYELGGLLLVPAGEAEALSVCTASFGFAIAGCGCYAPLVSSLLYMMGLGAIQVSGVIALLGNYQAWLISLLIIINLAFIYYQTGRISRKRRVSGRE